MSDKQLCNKMTDKKFLKEKTIMDFGEQWTRFTENEGYYGSIELFKDIISPLLTMADFKGKTIAEIGSGTGRIVKMIAAAGAKEITAIEPSDAFIPLKENTKNKQFPLGPHFPEKLLDSAKDKLNIKGNFPNY